MGEKRVYRNVLRSRRMIRDAFLELVNAEEYGKLTVTDIIRQADLNRSTFYSHYANISAVAEEIQNEIIQRNTDILRQMPYGNILLDPRAYLNGIGNTLAEITKVSSRMGKEVSFSPYLERFKTAMTEDILSRCEIPEQVRQSPAFISKVHFLAGGISTVYQQWAEGNLECTLEEVTEEIAVLIHSFVLELMNAKKPK